MRIIIDRIEGEMLVVELFDKSTIIVPSCLFPNAKEGDIFNITKDCTENAERQRNIRDRFNRLKNSNRHRS